MIADRPRVLIVDDEGANRELMARMLGRDHYEVHAVADGPHALDHVRATPPDLVLLDVAMPGADGFSVCRSIKASPATRLLPVVLVTGADDRANRLRGIESGADDLIAKPIDRATLTARVKALISRKRYTDDLECAESVITSLALTIEARDRYTDGHSQRLAELAVALGARIGLSAADLQVLRKGAYLHDVGKIGIPDAILQKPSSLTHDEYVLMKQHPIIGERLCGDLRSLRLVKPIVRSHHELRDGSGYPDGLVGDEIPLFAQIVGIADAYDAITSRRSYREGRSVAAACEELRRDVELGKRRADLVEAFVDVVGTADATRGEQGLPHPSKQSA